MLVLSRKKKKGKKRRRRRKGMRQAMRWRIVRTMCQNNQPASQPAYTASPSPAPCIRTPSLIAHQAPRAAVTP
ncbi:hypothetical protein LY76DRAFT_596220 [Colletotrichum caudatum]|nr:hypothetical protein LY76DRAFT_596220 [Colletotrichum caudatum]